MGGLLGRVENVHGLCKEKGRKRKKKKGKRKKKGKKRHHNVPSTILQFQTGLTVFLKDGVTALSFFSPIETLTYGSAEPWSTGLRSLPSRTTMVTERYDI
jgi:hypothetical protein